MSWFLHVCDVCRLLDGDYRQKMCAYCSICNAFICEHDVSDWQRRGRAAALAIAERVAG